MSVFIAPAVGVVTGLLSQKSAERARKIASDVSRAQSTGGTGDQDYLTVLQSRQGNLTRQEYDIERSPIEYGRPGVTDQQRAQSGLFPVSLASRGYQGQSVGPGVIGPPAGSSVLQPAGGGGGAMPSWLLPAGLAAAGLLVVSMFMGKRR